MVWMSAASVAASIKSAMYVSPEIVGWGVSNNDDCKNGWVIAKIILSSSQLKTNCAEFMPRVSYNGLIADVRDEDLEAGIADLAICSRNERKQILKSVEKALDRVLKMTPAQREKLSPQQLQDVANDIGIWFAGETLAGRADQYKAMVQ